MHFRESSFQELLEDNLEFPKKCTFQISLKNKILYMTGKSLPFREFLRKASYFVLLKLKYTSKSYLTSDVFQHYSRDDILRKLNVH